MASYRRWSVWDNKGDRLEILDGTAQECADAMGKKLGTFYRNASKCLNGKEGRWHIVPTYAQNVKRRWFEAMDDAR